MCMHFVHFSWVTSWPLLANLFQRLFSITRGEFFFARCGASCIFVGSFKGHWVKSWYSPRLMNFFVHSKFCFSSTLFLSSSSYDPRDSIHRNKMKKNQDSAWGRGGGGSFTRIITYSKARKHEDENMELIRADLRVHVLTHEWMRSRLFNHEIQVFLRDLKYPWCNLFGASKITFSR